MPQALLQPFGPWRWPGWRCTRSRCGRVTAWPLPPQQQPQWQALSFAPTTTLNARLKRNLPRDNLRPAQVCPVSFRRRRPWWQPVPSLLLLPPSLSTAVSVIFHETRGFGASNPGVEGKYSAVRDTTRNSVVAFAFAMLNPALIRAGGGGWPSTATTKWTRTLLSVPDNSQRLPLHLGPVLPALLWPPHNLSSPTRLARPIRIETAESPSTLPSPPIPVPSPPSPYCFGRSRNQGRRGPFQAAHTACGASSHFCHFLRLRPLEGCTRSYICFLQSLIMRRAI